MPHAHATPLVSLYTRIASSTPSSNRLDLILHCNVDHGFSIYSTKRLCTLAKSVLRCTSLFGSIDSATMASSLILVDVT